MIELYAIPSVAINKPASFRAIPTGDVAAGAVPESGQRSDQRVAGPPRSGTDTPGGQLGREQQAKLQELRSLDREVRAHEQAHRTAAGNLAQGATRYEYETGSDGVRYAVGGEVQIDTSPVEGDPRATIAKAERIIAAALAPSQPSSQDRAVAAKAAALAAEARVALAREGEGSDEGAMANGDLDIRTTKGSAFAPEPPRPEAILLNLTA